jgi:dTDP-4-dehydrorhamnose reductase
MNRTGPILIIGGHGQMGQAFAHVNPDLIRLSRSECDLTKRETITAALAAYTPATVINAAAYTAVDLAEQESEAAFAQNATGPAQLAEICAARKIGLVHYSTDYVFDGQKPAPYLETDPIAPLSVYGKSKAAGEQAVLAAHPQALVVRTAWLFSPWGKNFVKTLATLSQSRDQFSVVADQIGNPTPAEDLARATMTMLRQDGPKGLYHYGGAPSASWYDLAAKIFACVTAKTGKEITLTPTTTAAYKSPAARPARGVLGCQKILKDYGISQPDWAMRVQEIVDQLLP